MEITNAPIIESKNHVEAYRTIGVGIQGMADILARGWKTYGDLEFITVKLQSVFNTAVFLKALTWQKNILNIQNLKVVVGILVIYLMSTIQTVRVKI